MKFRLAFTLTIERTPPPEPEQHEHRDNDGSLAENIGHPRYIGFAPEVPNDEG